MIQWSYKRYQPTLVQDLFVPCTQCVVTLVPYPINVKTYHPWIRLLLFQFDTLTLLCTSSYFSPKSIKHKKNRQPWMVMLVLRIMYIMILHSWQISKKIPLISITIIAESSNIHKSKLSVVFIRWRHINSQVWWFKGPWYSPSPMGVASHWSRCALATLTYSILCQLPQLCLFAMPWAKPRWEPQLPNFPEGDKANVDWWF